MPYVSSLTLFIDGMSLEGLCYDYFMEIEDSSDYRTGLEQHRASPANERSTGQRLDNLFLSVQYSDAQRVPNHPYLVHMPEGSVLAEAPSILSRQTALRRLCSSVHHHV